MTTTAELRADIAEEVAHASERLAVIAQLLANGKFVAASIELDYVQGNIKRAERAQKALAKQEALEVAHKRIAESADVADVFGALAEFERTAKREDGA